MNRNDLSKPELEEGSLFAPKFDASGLMCAVVVDAESKDVLMVGFMNEEALLRTRTTGKVHFWSRSRKALWMKGETSGHVLNVEEVLVDCDQDALVVKARAEGPTCHTQRTSCFYRRLDVGSNNATALKMVSR